MGKGILKIACLFSVLAALVMSSAGNCFACDEESASAADDPSLKGIIAQPEIIAIPPRLADFVRACQDVVTVEEYERLTGVHKRLGIGLWGGFGILGGGTAGSGTILTRKLEAGFSDIWASFGMQGGIDLSIMVMPLYVVNVGVGVNFHDGQSFDSCDWDGLSAVPIYLGVRFNLPLGVGFEHWLDFENPDLAAETNAIIPIPYVKFKAIAYYMKEVYVDGWVVEPGKAAVGGVEQFFRRGIYAGAYAGGGIELRLSSIGIYAEIGFRYVWHPKLTRRFDQMLTNGDFSEITAEFGAVYYFGSGRLIKVGM